MYVCRKLFCIKTIGTCQIIFYHEEVFCELLLGNFFSFKWFGILDVSLLYICRPLEKKFKNEFSSVSFEQDMTK
jgi:hypothetical protein